MTKIIVVGGNFAGFTSALELKRKLGNSCEVLMISKSPDFLFIPSLLWVSFGKREPKDISIPLAPIMKKAQVDFIQSEVTQILPEEKIVRSAQGDYKYDYLIIATGPEWLFNQFEGFGLNSEISYIVTPETAMKTRQRWQEFVKNPGPAVVGASQGTQCIPPTYEFLFILEKQCRIAGIRNKVDITFITPEPFPGHMGIGGITGSRFFITKFLRLFHINYITNAEIKQATHNSIILKSGQNLPFKFSMIIPVFKGARVVSDSTGLGNENAFLPVNNMYQHKKYPEIFGVGIAADYPIRLKTPVRLGMPKTGYAADVSAKTAAKNIVRLIKGNHRLEAKPMGKIPDLCILDAGDKEMLSIANSLFKPRKFSLVIPNPINNVGKVLFEKYYLGKVRKGYSWLP